MTLTDYLHFLQTLISFIPFTIVDGFLFICLAIFVASENQREFLKSIIILACVLGVYCMVLLLYPFISMILHNGLINSKGVADGISMLFAMTVLGAALAVVYRLFILNAEQELLVKKIPIINGVFGGMTFCIIVSAMATLLLSFPLTSFIKTTITESTTLSYLVSVSQSLESVEQKVVGKDNSSTLNFLTVNPATDNPERISRGALYSVDNSKNDEILQLINTVRQNKGMSPVQENKIASKVSQALALRMATTNKMSRTEIEGNTPFDLLDNANAVYSHAYFMTAQAQSVEIGIRGLAQIPQYNNQLNSPEYSAVGVGVVSVNEHGYIISLLFIH